MSVIEVKNLSKTFKSKVKGKGLSGSIKSIFKPKYKTIKAAPAFRPASQDCFCTVRPQRSAA